MTIKAIETKYKGYRFRSRLEARWAVAFDNLGIDWTYEPQGFELPSGAWYLPDFRISVGGKKAWVEIKGGLRAKPCAFDEKTAIPFPYRGMEKTEEFAREICKRGGVVFLFGDIPETISEEIILNNWNMFTTSYQDGSWIDGAIVVKDYDGEKVTDFYTSDMANEYGQYSVNGWEERCFSTGRKYKLWWPTEAYTEARSARFDGRETAFNRKNNYKGASSDITICDDAFRRRLGITPETIESSRRKQKLIDAFLEKNDTCIRCGKKSEEAEGKFEIPYPYENDIIERMDVDSFGLYVSAVCYQCYHWEVDYDPLGEGNIL